MGKKQFPTSNNFSGYQQNLIADRTRHPSNLAVRLPSRQNGGGSMWNEPKDSKLYTPQPPRHIGSRRIHTGGGIRGSSARGRDDDLNANSALTAQSYPMSKPKSSALEFGRTSFGIIGSRSGGYGEDRDHHSKNTSSNGFPRRSMRASSGPANRNHYGNSIYLNDSIRPYDDEPTPPPTKGLFNSTVSLSTNKMGNTIANSTSKRGRHVYGKTLELEVPEDARYASLYIYIYIYIYNHVYIPS